MSRIFLIIFFIAPFCYAGHNTGRSVYNEGENKIVDDSRNVASVDAIVKAIKTITTTHSEIHSGHMYSRVIRVNGVVDGSSMTAIICTSTNNIHMATMISAGGDCYIDIYENCVVTSSGTLLPGINLLRESVATSGVRISTSATNVNGTLIAGDFLPGGAGNPAAVTPGFITRPNSEVILKPFTIYAFVSTNVAGTTQPIAIRMEWYEEE